MPNIQWMSYSFVRLYLSKCDVCVLNHIWINPKIFLIILYVFGNDFYHSLCSCLVLTLFSLFKHVLFWKTSVRIFDYSFWLLAWAARNLPVLTTRFGDLQAVSPSCEFTQKGFATQLVTCQSRNTQNQLFKELFHGKLILNLSHPLINPSFNIFTSKPNQFEWFFISLTSLR